jgi:hypothetical protein
MNADLLLVLGLKARLLLDLTMRSRKEEAFIKINSAVSPIRVDQD